MAAVGIALAMLSMHAVDAHPKAEPPSGSGHEHHAALTEPAAAPAAHDLHAHHGTHGAAPDPVPHQPASAPGTAFAWDVATPITGPAGSGHANAFGHHFSMCAAVILAVLSTHAFRASRRMSWLAVRRLVGTSLGLDPPVPRLVFVRSA